MADAGDAVVQRAGSPQVRVVVNANGQTTYINLDSDRAGSQWMRAVYFVLVERYKP